jgi:hypothetical protein
MNEQEQPGAHHLTPENIAATIKDLREIEDGTTLFPVENRDWCTMAGVLARIIEHLARRAEPSVTEQVDARHDNLRDNIGQAISDYIDDYTDEVGNVLIVCRDADEIGALVDKIMALITSSAARENP